MLYMKRAGAVREGVGEVRFPDWKIFFGVESRTPLSARETDFGLDGRSRAQTGTGRGGQWWLLLLTHTINIFNIML